MPCRYVANNRSGHHGSEDMRAKIQQTIYLFISFLFVAAVMVAVVLQIDIN